jgi:hypothetical protein
MSFTRSSFLHQDAGRPKQGDQPPIVLSGKPCDRLAVPLDGCSLSNLTIASTGDGKSAAGLPCHRHKQPKIAFSVRIVATSDPDQTWLGQRCS